MTVDNFNNRDQRSEIVAPFECKAVSEKGVFEGYGSAFGNTDLDGDVIARGAFAASLRAKGPAQIALLWQHDPRQPIGVYEDIREDSRGLYVKGRLLLDVQKGNEAYSLLKAGALTGLSIGFRTVDAEWDKGTNGRTITEADLWEISLVTFPANPEARVSGVKHFGSVREVETALREKMGLARSVARRLAPMLMQELDHDEAMPRDLVEAIGNAAEGMKGIRDGR